MSASSRLIDALGRRPRLVLLAAAGLFTVVNAVLWWHTRGDDFSSLYVAGKLVAQGKFSHIFDHDWQAFDTVQDPAWDAAGRAVHFHGFLHPFVQVPLLAALLAPLTVALPFVVVNKALLLVSIVATAGTVWLTGRMFEPRLLRPQVYAAALLVVTVSEPFRYSLHLGQTTPLILFGTVLALHEAQRGRQLRGGVLLAVVTAVKLTPVLLAFYWLLHRGQRRAAGYFAGCAALIGLASLLVLGVGTNHAYLATLKRVSNAGLPSFNNQSFVGWLLSGQLPSKTAFDFHIHHVPLWIRGANALLAVVVAGVFLTRITLARRRGAQVDELVIGAAFLLPLMFTPISWTHYYLAMIVPVAILFRHFRERAEPWGQLFVVAIIALNLRPTAANSVFEVASNGAFVRSHLLSATLAAIALLCMRLPGRAEPAPPVAPTEAVPVPVSGARGEPVGVAGAVALATAPPSAVSPRAAPGS